MTLQFEEVLDKSNGVLVDRDSTPEMIYRARDNPSQTRLAIQAILFLSQDVLRQMRQNHKIKNNYLISVIEEFQVGNNRTWFCKYHKTQVRHQWEKPAPHCIECLDILSKRYLDELIAKADDNNEDDAGDDPQARQLFKVEKK